MTMIKFATFTVLSAQIAGTDQRYESALGKTAHRHEFIYDPKPGYLYVRSRAISSRTNDNFDTFPAHSIKEAWRTFIGKPVFVNHSNANHRRARGVIIDAALHEDTAPDGSADTWVEVLHEVDAIRFPKLAEAVVKGHIDRTSMGTEVAISTCSYCKNVAANPAEYCRHIPAMKGQRITRTTASGSKESVLISEICEGLSFFENSLLVEAPADPTAKMWGVDTRGLAGDPTTAMLVATSSRRTAALRAVVAEDTGTDFTDYEIIEAEAILAAIDIRVKNCEKCSRNKAPGSSLCYIHRWMKDTGENYPVRDRVPLAAAASLKESTVRTASRHTAGGGLWFPEVFDPISEYYEYNWDGVGAARLTEELEGRSSQATGRWGYDAWRYDDLPARHTGLASSWTAAKIECETYVAGGQLSLFASRHTALGEQTAPPVVDTLRIEACPVCGDPNSFNGTKCEVCGYIKPPALFDDPDLEKAKQVDLRGGDTSGITDSQEPNSELECNSCGATFPMPIAPMASSSSTDVPAVAPAGIKSTSAFPKATPVAPKKPNPFAKSKEEEDDEEDPEQAPEKDKPADKAGDTPADKKQPGVDEQVPDQPEPGDQPPVEGDIPADNAPDAPLAVGDTCPTCQQGTLEEIAIVTDPVATPAPGGQQGDLRAVVDPAQPAAGKPDAPAAKPPGAPPANPDPAIGDKDPNQPTAPADNASQPDKAKHPDAGIKGEAPVDEQDGKDKKPNPFDKGDGEDKKNPFAKSDDKDDSDSEDDSKDEKDGKDKKSLPPWMKKKESSHRVGNRPKEESKTMARNPAQVNRNRLIEALRTQQRQISVQATENEQLRRAVLTIASAAGVAKHPHFAALRKKADEDNAADAAALAPAATDDPTNVGGAPSSANTGVTPSGTTDVSNINVALPADTFGEMVDVTQQVSGTEGPPVGDAAHVETDVRVGTPDQTPFPDNSGWTKASRENPQVRLMASLRLAKARAVAGIADEGDDMSQGQAINDDRALSLAVIQHEINTLSAVAKVKDAPVQRATAASRRLVPQAAQGQRSVPSLTPITAGSSTGSTDGSLEDSLF